MSRTASLTIITHVATQNFLHAKSTWHAKRMQQVSPSTLPPYRTDQAHYCMTPDVVLFGYAQDVGKFSGPTLCPTKLNFSSD